MSIITAGASNGYAGLNLMRMTNHPPSYGELGGPSRRMYQSKMSFSLTCTRGASGGGLARNALSSDVRRVTHNLEGAMGLSRRVARRTLPRLSSAPDDARFGRDLKTCVRCFVLYGVYF